MAPFLYFLLFSFLPLSSATGCYSGECDRVYICYPFNLDSKTSCQGASLYPIQCQNGSLQMNNHTVDYIDYQNRQIAVEDSECKNSFEKTWKDFLAQVPDANASKFSCNDTLIIQWTQQTGASAGGSGAVILVIAIIVFIFWYRKRNKLEDHSSKELKSIQLCTNGFAKLYTYGELEKATNFFANDMKLGTGGFGTVYKGTLEDGTVVAIKRSNYVGELTTQDIVNEVIILSQVNHRNLVRLLGCCIEKNRQLLVYEYISNGTLFDHLHGKFKSGKLKWCKRLDIAVDAAEALAYLHSAADPPIYHRDVKSANILLDEAFTARVSDFGISRIVPHSATHVSTMVRGTPGYLDPEYLETYRLTEKSDVFSFGVVLLELITGLRPVDFDRPSNQTNLSVYTIPIINTDMLHQILDPSLQASSNPELLQSIKCVAHMALECVSTRREHRPFMKQVLAGLLKIREFSENSISAFPFSSLTSDSYSITLASDSSDSTGLLCS